MRLMAELNHTELDYARCAEAIQSDSTLTYRFLEYMRGLAFFRGSLAASIQHNLVLVGAEELRRWTVLALAYDNNVTSTGEFVRLAYLRGAFASRLMRYGPHRHDASWGLLMGIFSLMDQILNIDMRELLHKVAMPQDIAQALLLEEDNYYAKLMQYILAYEFPWRNLVLPDLQMRLTDREVARIYMDSIVETDRIFKLMEGALS
jgi:EAL and modified HD-GYP domain-containing signal transduction protein